MTMVRVKFPRASCRRSGPSTRCGRNRAMQWTRKSIAPPLRLQGLEHHVDGAQILDVAGENQRRAKASGQRLDPFAERFALIGERQLPRPGRPKPWRRPRRSSGSFATAHHQAALAVHQSRFAHARLAPGQASMCLNTIAAFVPPISERIRQHRAEFNIIATGAHNGHVGESRVDLLDMGAFAD